MEIPIPNEIGTFEAFLLNKGLVCERRVGPDRKVFGNRILQYGNGIIGVQLVLDRSIWLIDIADVASRPNEWYDFAIVLELLVHHGIDVMPLNTQIEMVQTNWQSIIDCFGPQHREKTHTQLDSLRKERAKRLFGQ